MISKETIDDALSAHAQWKQRLRNAISNGVSEFKVVDVKRDNVCQFGQWLATLTPAEMNTEEYKKVKILHAEFHETAANILALALNGKQDEAKKLLDFGGSYNSISGKLVLAMQRWKAKL